MSHVFLDMQETLKNILEKAFCFILSLFCPISLCVKNSDKFVFWEVNFFRERDHVGYLQNWAFHAD
jgi:hypothetical protein